MAHPIIQSREAQITRLEAQDKALSKESWGWLALGAAMSMILLTHSVKISGQASRVLFLFGCGVNAAVFAQGKSAASKRHDLQYSLNSETNHFLDLQDTYRELESALVTAQAQRTINALTGGSPQGEAYPDWFTEACFKINQALKNLSLQAVVSGIEHIDDGIRYYVDRVSHDQKYNVLENALKKDEFKHEVKFMLKTGGAIQSGETRGRLFVDVMDEDEAYQTVEAQVRPTSRVLETQAQRVEEPTEYAAVQSPVHGEMHQNLSVSAPARISVAFTAEDELFTKFLKSPHNWVCGKTNGGKTFLLSRLLIEWVKANPDGEVYILDRNFGKPDRETGEIFDWNGIDEGCVYHDDAEILWVLETQAQEMMALANDFANYAREQMRARREGREVTIPRPQKKKVLIVLTEENAIAQQMAPSRIIDSPIVNALKPLLQQGNGYGYKVVMDGQSIAVNASGIQESIRQQLSICMVGENCVNSKEVSQFGSDTKDLVARCEPLFLQKRRVCIIQLGEGAPIASVVPEMGFIRNFRFNGEVQPPEPPEVTDFDNRFKRSHGFDPDDAMAKPSSNIPPESPIALLIVNLRQWINTLNTKPTDAQLKAKLLELTGQNFKQKDIDGLKGVLELE